MSKESLPAACLVDEVTERYGALRPFSEPNAIISSDTTVGVHRDVLLECGRCDAVCVVSQKNWIIGRISRVLMSNGPTMLICPHQPIEPLYQTTEISTVHANQTADTLTDNRADSAVYVPVS